MSSNNQNQINTNDAIDDLKSSITNLVNFSKSLQSLSGRLSLIGEECKNINGMIGQFQSNLSKMQKSLSLIEIEKANNSENGFWLKSCPKHFNPLLEKSTILSPPRRDEATFRKYLSRINIEFDVHNILFNLLGHIAKYNGYVYGGFVRDFLVPGLVYGENLSSLDFKDIDIWFSDQSQADNFIQSFNQQNSAKLIDNKSRANQKPVEEYGCGHPFTRHKFYFSFDKIPLFMVDVVVAKQLPVNDFSVNLLIFKAKNLDFHNLSLSWFSVGEDYDGQYCHYSPLILMMMIKNRQTDLLPGYQLPSSLSVDSNFKYVVGFRCKRMIGWGWTFGNKN